MLGSVKNGWSWWEGKCFLPHPQGAQTSEEARSLVPVGDPLLAARHSNLE